VPCTGCKYTPQREYTVNAFRAELVETNKDKASLFGLGDKQRALDGLEKAYEAHSQNLTFLKVDKLFDPLHRCARRGQTAVERGINRA
jgi:hypothetical protein